MEENKENKITTFFKDLINFIVKVVEKFIATSMHIYAANASYFMIIAAVPTTMLLISCLSLIPNVSIDTFFENVDVLIPNIPYVRRIVDYCMGVARSLASPSLISLNIGAAIIATSGVLHSLSFAIKKTHGYNDRFNFIKLRVISLLNVIIFIVLIVVMLIAFLFGDMISNALDDYIPITIDFVKKLLSYRYSVAFIMLVLFLLSFYMTSTDFKRPFRANFWGAVIASILWIFTSIGFSLYFTYVPILNNIYGSLFSVVVVMIYLWAVFMIILAGATCNEILYPQVFYIDILKEKRKEDKEDNKKDEAKE